MTNIPTSTKDVRVEPISDENIPSAMICNRVSDGLAHVPSTGLPCGSCGELVWVSNGTSLPLVERWSIPLICIPCLRAEEDEATFFVTPETVAETAKHMEKHRDHRRPTH